MKQGALLTTVPWRIAPAAVFSIMLLSACAELKPTANPAGLAARVAVAIENTTENPEVDAQDVSLLEIIHDILNMPMLFTCLATRPYIALASATFQPGDYVENVKLLLKDTDCGQASPNPKARAVGNR